MSRTGIGFAYAVLAFALVACTADVDDPGFDASDSQMGDSEPADDDESTTPTTEGGATDSSGATTTTGGKTSTTAASSSSSSSSSGMADSGSAESSGDDSDTAVTGCGDDTVSPGEQCDGADLQGFDCGSLGLGSGTLGCDPVMCTFDTSMCMSNPGGTSG